MADPLTPAQLATFCHDLRSPLTAIAGALCVLEASAAPDLPPHARQAFEAGMRAIDHMTGLLDQLESQGAADPAQA